VTLVAAAHLRLHAWRALLPEGRLLPEEVWQRRHRVIMRVAFLQAVGLFLFAVGRGYPLHHAVFEGMVVATPLVFGVPEQLSRKVRSGAATASLFFASATLVHLAGGVTEAHFHFFVMVGLVALYQDWVPFGIGLFITVAHHAVLGTWRPHDVYDTSAAVHDPWLWALIHGGFVLGASITHLASWRLNEQQHLLDPLTGLANRTLLSETLHRALSRDSEPVSVLFIDLDDFKDVNDSRGHAAGDQLLKQVAERLRGCVRATDQVARLGGDEFALMVLGEVEDARAVAGRVLKAFSEPVLLDGQQVFVHASLGIASTRPGEDRDTEALLRNADLAMYLAKAAGKNRVVAYADGMDVAAREKSLLTEDLQQALARDQFEIHYQATVRLSDGPAEGYEALLRWRHPERGLVAPNDFIPLAEHSGQIVPIGAWVLREAIAQAAAWGAESGRPVGIAVNLSPHQLADDEVLHLVRVALAEHELPARLLTLEITEGVLVRDIEAVVGRLQALRALGVRIAIDDFGTGYSSLSYLRRLPVDIVKIDRSFISDLDGPGPARTLVASIINLADSLGLDVIAEGVETPEQDAALRTLRCAYGQGYLYGRPAPVADVAVLPVIIGALGL
jgi:diguanylate cyclase (GGDEF)-like protein